MPRPLTPSVYESFLGLNTESPSKIEERQAAALENLYLWNNGRELRRRGGTMPLNSSEDPPAGVDFDMLQAVRILGTDYLIGIHGTDIKDWLGSRAVISGSNHRFAQGIEANGAFLPDALYIGNGTVQNVRFNGTNVKTVCPSQPSSGTTTAGSGVGSLTGVYSYKITFFNADGVDGQPSVKTSDITVSSVTTITLSSIPTAPAADDCTGRHIWRTVNGGTAWYRVGTINDNTTTTFADTTLDTAVDTSLAVDESVVRFPPCQILVAHQLRLCGILCSTAEGDNRTLYVSDFQKPWSCPLVAPLDEVDDPTHGIRIPLPERPIGLATYGNALIVFFPAEVWTLTGNNPNNWRFDKWLNIGSVSHHAAALYKGTLLWLAADGLYAAQGADAGAQVQRISDDIRSRLDAISSANLAKAHALIWQERYYLMTPTRAYYFDFRHGQWGELKNWLWRHSTLTQSSASGRERIFATQYGKGAVWELETGTSDNGDPIATRWKSRDKDMGQFGRDKRVHRVVCRFQAGSGDATVKLYRGGGELLQTFTQDISDALRTGSSVSELADRAVEGARDEYFALEVTHEAVTTDFRILDAGLQYSLCT